LVNTGFVWLTPPAPCAGKSTLVKILSGIVKPDSGRIELNEVSFRPDSLMAVLGRHIDRRPGTQPAPTFGAAAAGQELRWHPLRSRRMSAARQRR
jgi:energy-coupling factor transporter ATP-binding protein EcfA2